MSGSIPTSSISFSGIVSAYNNVNSTNLSTTNISLSSFRGKSFSDSTTVPSSGAISLNSHFKGKTWDVPITFSSHTFTNCGATGRYGPTLSECRSAYSPSWVDNTSYFNVVTQGKQIWTVPITGTYEIEVWGASGGEPTDSGDYTDPGRGQKIKHQFSLTKDEKLYIMVGQEGGNTHDWWVSAGGGGGGGSFVVGDSLGYGYSSDPLIIAGGGNGANSWGWYVVSHGPDAVLYKQGRTGGDGGEGYDGGGSTNVYGRGGGGGGWNVDGILGTDGYGQYRLAFGKAFMNGGNGGVIYSYCDGGFGGGGASQAEGGGGGGWVGGDVYPAAQFYPPNNWEQFGASCFVKGFNNPTSLGLNTGHGKVIITKL